MEILKPYLGKYDGCSIFLNSGKYGPYLNYKDKLYSVPQCFQKPTFKLDDAIKIIDYKYKMKLQQIENKKDFIDVPFIEDNEINNIIKKTKKPKTNIQDGYY